MAQIQTTQAGRAGPAVARVVEDEREVSMLEHLIGSAHCSVVVAMNAGRGGFAYKAGVVRVGGKNLVIVVQIACESILRVVAPHNHPRKIKEHPHLSPWEAADHPTAKKIVSGEISTRHELGLRPVDGTQS